MKNPIVHFEIPVDDVERAKTFYTTVFDWQIEKFDMPAEGSTQGEPYYMVRTTEVGENNMPKTPGGINGGLMKRQQDGQPFMNYVSVTSIEETLKMITSNGGITLMPKMEIGANMGWIAVFKDTEGNMMGLHQMPKKPLEQV